MLFEIVFSHGFRSEHPQFMLAAPQIIARDSGSNIVVVVVLVVVVEGVYSGSSSRRCNVLKMIKVRGKGPCHSG